jgi:putative phosphoribosyl transferase
MASFHATAVHSFANYLILQDREDGGRQLAQRLSQYKGRTEDAIVIGLARGGVVTAYYVANELGLPLDVIVARKIGCPFHEELTIGALAQDGTCELNEYLMQRFSLKKSDLENTIQRERREADKRTKLYRGDKPPLNLEGKVVILVDDGVATGASAKAALLAIRKRHPSKTILATPVMPFERIGQFHGLVDDLVLLAAPRRFYAIGQFYRNFDRTEDDEVIEKLRDADERQRASISEKKGKKIDEKEMEQAGLLREERAAAGPIAATSK